MSELWKIVEQDLEEKGISLSRSVSYMEYMEDLLAKLILDIVPLLDQTKISADVQERLTILSQIMQFSSIDFTQLNSLSEQYKFAGIIEMKTVNAELREKYMTAILEGK